MTDTPTIQRAEWRWLAIATGMMLLVLALPFIWANTQGNFMGTLVSPIDGASYLVKMALGVQGQWLFELVYTPEPHEGELLYTFYIAMGHVARLLNVHPMVIFHVMRLIGAALMSVSIYRFAAVWLTTPAERRTAWALATVGAGVGWVALVAAQHIPPDILILPEAFPLQAAYANAHFPWAIASGITIATILTTAFFSDATPGLDARTLLLAASTLFLASASPFILLPLGVACATIVVIFWVKHKEFPLREASWGVVVAAAGLPLAVYILWSVSANPVMGGWMAQNLTPSPPVWDYALAFGPLLVLAALGLWQADDPFSEKNILLIVWVASIFIFAYSPLSLQRRFTTGVTIPLAIFAAQGMLHVIKSHLLRGVIFTLIVPSTLIALLIPVLGIGLGGTTFTPYYITDEEKDALEWVEANLPPESVILTAPNLSLYVPVYGARVVYAHPFETVNAEAREDRVLSYFAGEGCDTGEADYVIYNDRTDALSRADSCPPPTDEPLYTSPDGTLTLYEAP